MSTITTIGPYYPPLDLRAIAVQDALNSLDAMEKELGELNDLFTSAQLPRVVCVRNADPKQIMFIEEDIGLSAACILQKSQKTLARAAAVFSKPLQDPIASRIKRINTSITTLEDRAEPSRAFYSVHGPRYRRLHKKAMTAYVKKVLGDESKKDTQKNLEAKTPR